MKIYTIIFWCGPPGNRRKHESQVIMPDLLLATRYAVDLLTGEQDPAFLQVYSDADFPLPEDSAAYAKV